MRVVTEEIDRVLDRSMEVETLVSSDMSLLLTGLGFHGACWTRGPFTGLSGNRPTGFPRDLEPPFSWFWKPASKTDPEILRSSCPGDQPKSDALPLVSVRRFNEHMT